MKGLFIVSEGPDGSGKETQTRLLKEYLAKQGFNVVSFSFPTYGEDPVADLIKFMLHQAKEDWLSRDWRSKAVLYASNRLRFKEKIEEAINTPGNVVVCDRFVPSNQAHMGGLGSSMEEREARFLWIEKLEYEMMGLPKPDIVLLHTMPSKIRAELLRKREDGEPDAHEADETYLDKAERSYYELADLHSEEWRHIPADLDGILQTPEQVHQRVIAELISHPKWKDFCSERKPVEPVIEAIREPL